MSLDLRRGVLLEDAAVLLRWGASLEELRGLAHPSVSVWNDRVATVTWGKRAILEGLELNVWARLDRDLQHPEKPWEPLGSVVGTLYEPYEVSVRSSRFGEPNPGEEPQEATYQLALRHLGAVVGAPSHGPPRPFHMDAKAQWLLEGAEILLSARESEFGGLSTTLAVTSSAAASFLGDRFCEAVPEYRYR